MAGDRVYKDIKVFVERNDGKKQALVIGYQYDDNGKTRFQITAFPPPNAKCDWSGLVEERGERGARLQPARDARPYGTSGHGASVKHTGTPEQDDFGEGSDIPF